jgi:hypothetical protein
MSDIDPINLRGECDCCGASAPVHLLGDIWICRPCLHAPTLSEEGDPLEVTPEAKVAAAALLQAEIAALTADDRA